MEQNPNKPKILCVKISSNQRFFILGKEDGFSVYSCTPKFSLLFCRKFQKTGISIIDILESSNIFALVGNSKDPNFTTNKVFLWDDLNQKSIMEIAFPTPISALKITTRFLFVLTKKKCFIVEIEKRSILKSFSINSPSDIKPSNSFDFSLVKRDSLHIAIPHKLRAKIFYTNITKPLVELTIKLNTPSYQLIKFNCKLTFLAVVSPSGKQLLLYDLLTGELYQKFRIANKVSKVYSMSFTQDDKIIALLFNNSIVRFCSIQLNETTNRLVKIENQMKNVYKKNLINIEDDTQGICEFNEWNDLLVIYLNGACYRFTFDEIEKKITDTVSFNYLNSKEVLESKFNFNIEKEDERKHKEGEETKTGITSDKLNENKNKKTNENIENELTDLVELLEEQKLEDNMEKEKGIF
ncbi:wd repeat domain phosphoinositide-interacting protein [Anaeramoeba flamelloides]|uniref:Wd repeat domain phosphoinositide-interacting protein n=1 Tax=Anaeramoeba flamelloides TaxID=1746091 RepID=A0AAV8AAS1_9EUKA|nr:wd repeat domain phosphoinositide-interacting protein [Anaeramoeba flamelloides]